MLLRNQPCMGRRFHPPLTCHSHRYKYRYLKSQFLGCWIRFGAAAVEFLGKMQTIAGLNLLERFRLQPHY